MPHVRVPIGQVSTWERRYARDRQGRPGWAGQKSPADETAAHGSQSSAPDADGPTDDAWDHAEATRLLIDLSDIAGLTADELERKARSDPAWFQDVLTSATQAVEEDQKATQLAYYTPANPMAAPVHRSMAREIAMVGGNRSSKTDTALAELSIRMTGHIPISLEKTYPREKLAKLPIRARVVCNSLTDTLEPVIKPKLRWDQWNGVGDPADGRGHWGWLPRHTLKGGEWEKAYSEKYRTLSVHVDNYWTDSEGHQWSTRGTSTCQFLSYDQDLSAFAGSSMNLVIHDELPPADIYRENRMRTLDVRGQIYTAFTPPDEIGMSRADVAWFYDEVYEPGRTGDKIQFETFILHTEANRILNAEDVAVLAAKMTDEQREVRLHGNFLHLSGVVYSLFTSGESYWCFNCAKRITPMNGECLTCRGTDLDTFTHVIDRHEVPSQWPIVFVVDPHPRKKDACGWFAITPSDDIVMVAELEVDGTAQDVKRAIDELEDRHRLYPAKRLMDPNIATETNDKLGRGWSFRKAYDDVGLRCDLATDDINVGIQNVNELLRPDSRTRRPHFRVFRDCERFIYGMTHWAWDDWHRGGDKEPKEKVRDKSKDFPDLIRYLANDHPSFHAYKTGGNIFHRPSRPQRYAVAGRNA